MGIVIKYCVYLQLFFGRSPHIMVEDAKAGNRRHKKGVYLNLITIKKLRLPRFFFMPMIKPLNKPRHTWEPVAIISKMRC